MNTEDYNLKINSNNEITIRPVKETWNRKEVAIICVDEILDAIPDHTIELLNYFREVKKEISLL